VFVHGYGGDSYATWANFQLLIDNSQVTSRFHNCDIYFFQYESRDEWINASTDRFLNFLQQLILDPRQIHFTENVAPILPPQEREEVVSVLPSPRRYTHLVLVGHSEGGVVIRNAVIKRFKSRSSKSLLRRQWKLLMGSRLSLFAPAIAGFRPAGFLGVIMKMPWLGNTLNAILQNGAAYQDLSNPDFLKELKAKTESAARRNPHQALRAEIVWGYADKVVHPTKYEEDTEEFVEANHIHICKPCEGYLHPLQFVERGLEPPLAVRHSFERSIAR
jgi:hypothetical protein